MAILTAGKRQKEVQRQEGVQKSGGDSCAGCISRKCKEFLKACVCTGNTATRHDNLYCSPVIAPMVVAHHATSEQEQALEVPSAHLTLTLHVSKHISIVKNPCKVKQSYPSFQLLPWSFWSLTAICTVVNISQKRSIKLWGFTPSAHPDSLQCCCLLAVIICVR